MPYKLVIFDLDGTVLDTLADLRNSLNVALETAGLPAKTLDETRANVGHGIRHLIQASIPSDTPSELLDNLHRVFLEHYTAHCMDVTRPYDGIPELLAALRGHGLRLALLSNKAEDAVQILCRHFFPGAFDLVMGARPNFPKKPAPDGVLAVMGSLGGTPGNTLYVGDSEVDAATAKNAGLPIALVTWGFRKKDFLRTLQPEYLLDNHQKLQNLLMETALH